MANPATDRALADTASSQTAVAPPRRPPGYHREELARRLVDVLALPAGQVNDHERSFAGEILNELLNAVALELKVEVARRLAGVLVPPPSLLRRLLLEPIEVAEPLIEAFRNIPESLLIEAAGVSDAHRLAISRRPLLTDIVADTLLCARELDVVEQLLRRPEIALSEARVTALLRRTITEPQLREPLLQRLELQPHHGFTMFWWVGQTERRRIINRFAIDRTLIQNALKQLFVEVFPDPEPDEIVKRVLTLCDRRHRPRGRNGEAVAIEIVEKMLIAARANPTPDLCAATGLLAGVSPDTATRCLFDAGGEPFAILAKSTGVSRTAFADILGKAALMRRTDSPGPAFDVAGREYLLAIFDMTARDYSRTILRYWDWRRESVLRDGPILATEALPA